MEALRLTLFSGLILHKLIWEILKRKGKFRFRDKKSLQTLNVRLIKLAKILFLIFILIQTLFLEIFPISTDPGPLSVIGLIIFLAGLTAAMLGRIQLGENWVDIEDNQVLPEHALVRNGIYKYVRHPIYAGDLVLLIGLEFALNSWLVLSILFLIPVIAKQAVREEAILIKELPGYRDYCLYTKRFIPFIL